MTEFMIQGTRSNWDIQKTNFPEAVAILDFYHASEHLADFCGLISDQQKGERQFKSWRTMLLDGEVLQVMAEMKESLKNIRKKDCQ